MKQRKKVNIRKIRNKKEIQKKEKITKIKKNDVYYIIWFSL